MNNVDLIGRLTKDIELKYSSNQTAYARFSIAIDRGKDKNGNDQGADFPTIVCFGKTAENCERYLSKGRQVAVSGSIRTGSYEDKNGKKNYTVEIFANRVEFLGSKDDSKSSENSQNKTVKADTSDNVYASFSQITDDDIPF